MIIVTGSSGFIAGALVRKLVAKKNDIILCDFMNNNSHKSSLDFIEVHKLFQFIEKNKNSIDLLLKVLFLWFDVFMFFISPIMLYFFLKYCNSLLK